MRGFLLCALVLAILATPAMAGLMTRTFDPVEDDCIYRRALLGGDLDKAEKKERQTLDKTLKNFKKDSANSKADAKTIKKVMLDLGKQYPEDQAMTDQLNASAIAFADELDDWLDEVQNGYDLLDDANKKKASAEKAIIQARAMVESVRQATAVADKAKLIPKAEKQTAKADSSVGKGLKKEDLTAHEEAFYFLIRGGYQDADSCGICHANAVTDMLETAHWKWEGTAEMAEGHEDHVHGKTDLINNFCIAIPSNEGRCTQCHAGIGWADKSFDFADTSALDCLVCHDTSGSYTKDKTTAGAPTAASNLQMAAMKAGSPSRKNCLFCHMNAGGGDNVKHGDLSSDLVMPERTADVHMGTDGGDFACQKCHTTVDHKIAGMPLHSQDEGRAACTDCHDAAPHTDSTLNFHTAKIACQTCHIPTFARVVSTKVEWYWEDAGKDIAPIPTDPVTGRPTYDKKKGTFVWANNVKPELMWSNGKWDRMFIGENDKYTSTPVVLAKPVGALDDGVSKIYPFKKMVGTQPADLHNKTMLVPHLFGGLGGPNPYWAKYDWHLALVDGAAYAGQTYTGEYEFVDTVMYLSVNHEIAPKAQALGNSCDDCHDGGIDFTKLGYPGDPRY